MAVPNADLLFNDVVELFTEHYSYSPRFSYMLQKAEKIKRPVTDKPCFWDLIPLTRGPYVLIRLIRILKRHGLDLNQRNWRRETLLHHLIMHWAQETWSTTGLMDAMRILVEAGADPLATDDDNHGLLITCLYTCSDPEMFRFLVELTVGKVNDATKCGLTPLRLAVNCMNESAIRLLILKGANPLHTHPVHGNLLHWILTAVSDSDAPFSPYMKKLIQKYHKSLRDGLNGDQCLPLVLACTLSFCTSLPDDVFTLLIPSKKMINHIRVESEACGRPSSDLNQRSCLSHVIHSKFWDEKLTRMEQLVAAGAYISDEVMCSALRSSGRVVNKLLQLSAVTTVQHLVQCLEWYSPEANVIFKSLVNAMPAQRLSDSFPGAACAFLMHFIKNHHPHQSLDFEFLLKFMEDFDLDVNYNCPENGSLVHCLCHREVVGGISFLKQLLLKYSDKLDLDQVSTRDMTLYWMTDEDESQVTPLQIAIENGAYEMAVLLIQNYASTENLVLTKMQGTITYKDAEYYQLLRMLRLDGVQLPLLAERMDELREKYKDYGLPADPEPVKSLAELACLSLRRHSTKDDVSHLLQTLNLQIKVTDYLFLRHVERVPLPELPVIYVDEEDEEYDDDDDDIFFGAGIIDHWAGDDGSDVDAYIFLE